MGRACAWGAGALVVAAGIGRAQESPTPGQQPSLQIPSSRPEPTAAAAGNPQATGSVAGTVVNSEDAMMAGAAVRLISGGGSQRDTVTDSDGHFQLEGVLPGPFQLQVQLPGFETVTLTGTVSPGQPVQLPPAVLQLSTVNFQVDAVMPEQLALEQLHAEEHQRLAGVLPNFFVSYNWTAPPLTSRQKFALANHTVFDPGNLALVGTVAGVQQAADAFPGYGQGAAGYGRRYGADLGNLVVGSYMGGAVLPSLFRQDPRYFYKGTGSLRGRALYAISRAVITRGDNGHDQPNFSGVLGDLSAGAISNLYYDKADRQGAALTIENGFLGIAGDALNNLVQEFVLQRLTTRGKAKQSKP